MSRHRRNRPSSARARARRHEDARRSGLALQRLRHVADHMRWRETKANYIDQLSNIIEFTITLGPIDPLLCGWCKADRYSSDGDLAGRCPRCNQPVGWVQPFAFAGDCSVFAWAQITEGSCPAYQTPWPFDERSRWNRQNDEGETVEQARVRCSAVGILVGDALVVREHDPESRLELPDGFEADT